jgi:hypothetical protein
VLAHDESSLGLTPGFFGSDLDALELDFGFAPFVFFSVDDLSALGIHAGNILVSSAAGSFGVYASGIGHIGLLPDDDLDALILLDLGTPGVLDPGIDQALFSLTSFSPSTFTFTGAVYVPGLPGALSPSDVLFTDFTGSYSLFASAAELGLRPDDEMDALDTTTAAAAPEPASLAIWCCVMAGACGWLRKRKNC